jgi:hypothetical protein
MIRKSSCRITTLVFVLFFNANIFAGVIDFIRDVTDIFIPDPSCLYNPYTCTEELIDDIGNVLGWEICENKPVNEYASFPVNGKDTIGYIGGDTLGFWFNNVCSPEELRITKLQEEVRYYQDPKNNPLDWYWHCNFRIIKVDYEVTCSNKLIYPGTKYLFSKTWSRDGADEAKDFRAQEHEWIDVPLDFLSSDGFITKDPVNGAEWSYKPERLDIDELKQSWKGQAVNLPQLYLGEPGRLPRPMLLIHGIESDFMVWGVGAKNKTRGSDDFQKGLVTKYDVGTLPDLISKSYGLNTDPENINSNGIYFYQAPSREIDGKWRENSIVWSEENSQPKYLYKKIEEVLNDYFGTEWQENEAYKIDLVAHSQGGLVIREMLRGLRENPGFYPVDGLKNAANHINRVVTVNTPHFGSSLAVDNVEYIRAKYPGLALLIDDFDNPKKHSLVEVDVTPSFWVDRLAGLISPDAYWYLLGGVANTVSAIVGTDEVKLTIKGSYFGPYDARITTTNFFGSKGVSVSVDPDGLKNARSYMKEVRGNAGNLNPNGAFIKELNHANEELFPTRPDGTKITLLPMYSDSSHKILPEIFKMAGLEANEICEKNDDSKNCFAIGSVFDSYTEGFISKAEFNSNDSLWMALLDIQEKWLKQSDAIVEVESQKFIDDSKELYTGNPILKDYFLEPRNYVFHDAVNPWEAVLHGPKINNKGATQQGMDLACALVPACSEKFTVGGSAFLRLIASSAPVSIEASSMSVDLQGDFDVSPMYLDIGRQGLALSIGDSLILHAEYIPGEGSFINGKQIVNEKIATQPSIERKGNDIIITFNNYSGKSFSETISLPNLPSNIKLSVLADLNSTMSPFIVGSGSASDLETQKPPTPPPGHYLAPVTLAVLHREARGEYENNTSRPRFLIFNATEDTLEFSKVAYYFTADPARTPKVAVDYPYVPVSVEHLGGDQWRFVFDVGNKKIAPKDFYPSTDGWQIRVHYSDWHEYNHFDDWSADYNFGLVKENRKIVVYDKNGKIIWGSEALGFESEDKGIIPTPKGTIAWKDDAPWEANAFKPRVTVTNTGSVALSDYHAQLWFRVPQNKSLSPLNIWYAPESSPSVKNVSGRVWMLDLNFNKHILYPSDSVSEGNIGLNLTDWSAFDKIVCGIALKDKDGNILFGREPSIAECESYDGPNLLLPLYSIKELNQIGY